LAVFVLDLDGRTEEDAIAFTFGPLVRIDDLRGLETLREPMDLAIDLTELLLAVDILGVLAPIALRGGVRHVLDDLRTRFEELREIFLQLLRAGGSDVIRHSARDGEIAKSFGREDVQREGLR